MPGTPTATGDLLGDRRRQYDRRVPGGRGGRGDDQRLRHLRGDGGGVWTYTLDNSNAAVQALNDGPPLTDTFTVLSEDGTAQAGDHHHHRDQRRGDDHRHRDRRGRRGRGCLARRRRPAISLATDVDNAADVFQTVAAGRGDHQRLRHLRGDGGGRVDLHARQHPAAVDALNGRPPLTDTFTVPTEDGTAPAGDDHHHRHQRRADDHRPRSRLVLRPRWRRSQDQKAASWAKRHHRLCRCGPTDTHTINAIAAPAIKRARGDRAASRPGHLHGERHHRHHRRRRRPGDLELQRERQRARSSRAGEVVTQTYTVTVNDGASGTFARRGDHHHRQQRCADHHSA